MKTIRLMQLGLLFMAVFAFISCGESSSTGNNLPEYKLLSTAEPEISSNGKISPAQNLEYTIEINHPLQEDSLALIQDFFIEKGKSEFVGVNKILVRVFLEGASLNSLPYASLNLIGDNKDIIINGSSENVNFIKEQLNDYEILGCWSVYGDQGYLICKKDGKYYESYYNKKTKTLGELKYVKTKIVNGVDAYYSMGDNNHEYMVIKDDGLYIYDENENSDAVVWSNEPM